MSEWKKVKIDFKTIKLGDYIEPIKTTVAEMNMKNPIVYGVTNKEGIVQTGKPASKDISNYIALEENCFAFNPYRINVGSIGINDNNLTGCVSPAYVVFKTKNGLLPKFLFFYLKSDYGNHLINWYGNRGGVRNALRYSDLCNIDIPDIRSINQELLLKKFSSVSESINLITQELEIQKEYVKLLRQNILQDAIEGKLTANWRKSHPVIKGNPDYDAEALFEKIQEEKKNDKKQKSLAPISNYEKPFEIPDGWKWVRLGEICKKITDGTHHSPINTPIGDFLYVTAKNIKSDGVDLSEITYVSKTIHEEIYARCNVEFGDILYIKDGATTGIVCINQICEPFSLLSSVALLKTGFDNQYLKFAMESPSFYEQTRNQMYGVAITRVTLEKIINAIIPLPPQNEQIEILNILESSFRKIYEVELQIQERKTYTKQLMQSILKDAFEEK